MLEKIIIPGPLLCWTKIGLTDRVPPSISPVCHLPGPFLQAIRANPVVAGYPLPEAGEEWIKVMSSMYAIIIVTTDSCSIACATKVLDDFCVATGALVNRDKSELFLSHYWREELTASFTVRRNNIKLLGVTFQEEGEPAGREPSAMFKTKSGAGVHDP